jgi:glucose dehydrogenase
MKSLTKIVSTIVTIVPLSLMMVAAPTFTFAQAQSSPADWTEFHRDNMQRWNPYETVLGVNNVAKLKLTWSFATGYPGQSSPAVVNGVLYDGSNDGNVYALNANTGEKLWSHNTGIGTNSAPPLRTG